METKDFINKYIFFEDEVISDDAIVKIPFTDIVKICDAFANEKVQELNLITNEKNRLYSENLDIKTRLFLEEVNHKEITNKLVQEISILKKEQSPLPITIKENMNDTAIIITAYNESRFIKKQVDLIRRFHKEPVDIIIVDNSDDPSTVEQIKYYNKELGCPYLKTNASSKNGSESHAFSLNLSYNIYKDSYKYIAYFDHDLFPVKEFSIKEMLGDNIATGVGQNKDGIEYFWPGLFFLNNEAVDRSIVDMSYNHELKLDSGGNTHVLMSTYGKDKCPFLDEKHVQNPHFNKSMYNFYAMMANDTFCHIINGSAWNSAESNDHNERLNSMFNIIDEKTNGK